MRILNCCYIRINTLNEFLGIYVYIYAYITTIYAYITTIYAYITTIYVYIATIYTYIATIYAYIILYVYIIAPMT